MLPRIECRVGEPVTLKGYAIDVGHAITAVQFSLDGGQNWTGYATKGANDYQRVNWSFEYIPPEQGVYELLVRSVNDAGKPSPDYDTVELIAMA